MVNMDYGFRPHYNHYWKRDRVILLLAVNILKTVAMQMVYRWPYSECIFNGNNVGITADNITLAENYSDSLQSP